MYFHSKYRRNDFACVINAIEVQVIPLFIPRRESAIVAIRSKVRVYYIYSYIEC